MQELANSYWFWLLLFTGLAVVYFLPTLIGIIRGVEQLALVIVLNVVGGVTGVGWLGALILAFGLARRRPVLAPLPSPEPEDYPVYVAAQPWQEESYY